MSEDFYVEEQCCERTPGQEATVEILAKTWCYHFDTLSQIDLSSLPDTWMTPQDWCGDMFFFCCFFTLQYMTTVGVHWGPSCNSYMD